MVLVPNAVEEKAPLPVTVTGPLLRVAPEAGPLMLRLDVVAALAVEAGSRTTATTTAAPARAGASRTRTLRAPARTGASRTRSVRAAASPTRLIPWADPTPRWLGPPGAVRLIPWGCRSSA